MAKDKKKRKKKGFLDESVILRHYFFSIACSSKNCLTVIQSCRGLLFHKMYKE